VGLYQLVKTFDKIFSCCSHSLRM